MPIGELARRDHDAVLDASQLKPQPLASSIAARLPRREVAVRRELPVLDRVLVGVDVPVGYRPDAAVASLDERELPGLRQQVEFDRELGDPSAFLVAEVT